MPFEGTKGHGARQSTTFIKNNLKNIVQWSAKMFLRSVTGTSVAITCWIALFTGPSIQAQQDICVVDIAQVFKNHNQFNRQLEGLKQEAEQFKFTLQQKAQQLRTKSERLKDFSPGSDEFKQLETELAQESANLEVDQRSKTRDFMQLEAKLHFDTYVHVTKLIAGYCEQNDIRLALRYDSTQMSPDDPNTIMQRVNDHVIFHQPQRDITQTIIQLANQESPATGNRPSDTQNR